MATKLSRLLRGLGRRRIKDWRDLPHWSKDAEYLRQKDEWANVRKGMAAKRYNSYGNRYLRSLGLSVRLGGDGGSTLCGAGSCLANAEYGTPGLIKNLTYQFSDGSPVSIFTTESWIGFFTEEILVSNAGTRQVPYAVSLYRDIRNRTNPPNCSTITDLFDYSGFYGDADVWYLMGPVRWQISASAGDSCNSFGYRVELFHHTSNWLDVFQDIFDCSDTGLLEYTDVEQEWFLDFGDFPVWTDFAYVDTFSTYSPVYLPCVGVDPPDSIKQKITVFDSSGVLHTATSDSLVPAEVTISQGSLSDGLMVQSSKYPDVWYSVPANYSSCNCGDFTQRVTIPARAARSWVGTNAGGFNPCKHIMAVKRVLKIPQSFTDYVPYAKQYREDVPKPRYEQDNGRLDGYR